MCFCGAIKISGDISARLFGTRCDPSEARRRSREVCHLSFICIIYSIECNLYCVRFGIVPFQKARLVGTGLSHLVITKLILSFFGLHLPCL